MIAKTKENKKNRPGGHGGAAAMEALRTQEKIKITPEQKKNMMADFIAILSPDRVRDESNITTYYRGPAHGTPRRILSYSPPDLVVSINNKEELKEVFKIAYKYKVPVTPVGLQSTMLGGIPLNGGIVVEFMGMNKIEKIDLDQNYVIVGPGTSVKEVQDIIQPKGFTLAKGSYPGTFPIISTLVAWFSQHNFSNRMLDQVIGLEVTTPDGSIINTGTMGYGETEHWSDIQSSFTRLTNLFTPHQATIGVITKAAIRIWPMLEKTAVPVVGFDDFKSAYRWSHAMAKSSLTDQSMVWPWLMVGGLEYGRFENYLDYLEAKTNYTQEEAPKELGLFNVFAFAQMRGYKEEIEGALKTAERLAKEYGGKYLSEEYMQENLPRTWQYYTDQYKEFTYDFDERIEGFSEGGGFSLQFIGPREEQIKVFEGGNEFLRNIGWKNWAYYTRMMNGGQSPWFRLMPSTESTTPEEVATTVKVASDLTDFVLDNYGVDIQQNLLYFNDPENPEEVIERAKPIRRLMRAIQNEFDPESLLSPAMKKFTLL